MRNRYDSVRWVDSSFRPINHVSVLLDVAVSCRCPSSSTYLADESPCRHGSDQGPSPDKGPSPVCYKSFCGHDSDQGPSPSLINRFVDTVRTRDRAQSLTTVVVISSIFVFITLTTTFIVAVVCCKRNAVFALHPHRHRRRGSAGRSSKSTYSPGSGSRDCEHRVEAASVGPASRRTVQAVGPETANTVRWTNGDTRRPPSLTPPRMRVKQWTVRSSMLMSSTHCKYTDSFENKINNKELYTKYKKVDDFR